jgi:hypothetical protein
MDAKYPNHPYKGEIDKRIDNGDSAKSITKWLKTFGDEKIALSLPTIIKIRRRREALSPTLRPRQAIKLGGEPILDKKIKKLWETVKMCEDLEKRMSAKRAVTSIKDWQYINQQKQEALKLISEIQGEKAVGGDISLVLTKIFAKIDKDSPKSEDETIDAVISELKGNAKDESGAV